MIPVEDFGFCDELLTAVGPCDQKCIILSRDVAEGSGFQRTRRAVFKERKSLNFKTTVHLVELSQNPFLFRS